MFYAENGRFALSVSVKLSMVKYSLKVINSGNNQLISIVYEGMRQDTYIQKYTWAMKVKTILNEYGFGSAWLNHSVEDQTNLLCYLKEE